MTDSELKDRQTIQSEQSWAILTISLPNNPNQL